MSLTGATAYGSISATEQITSAGGGVDTHGGGLSFNGSLGNGTGAGNAQKVGDLVFNPSTSGTTIDLSAMAGGINNAAINFSKIKWFMASNTGADSNTVNVAFNGSNGCTNVTNGTISLQTGENLVKLNPSGGYVVDSTHKNVTFTAVAGAPQVRLTIVGEGA